MLKVEPLAELSQKRVLSILTQEWARSEKILFIAHHQETEAEYKSHMLSESKTTFFVHIQMNEKKNRIYTKYRIGNGYWFEDLSSYRNVLNRIKSYCLISKRIVDTRNISCCSSELFRSSHGSNCTRKKVEKKMVRV